MERLATREPVSIDRDTIVEALHAARAERDDQIAAALAREVEVDDAGRP